jgi:hypothetical protein
MTDSAEEFSREWFSSGASSVLLTGEFLPDKTILLRPLCFSSSAFPSPFDLTLAPLGGMSSNNFSGDSITCNCLKTRGAASTKGHRDTMRRPALYFLL